LSSSWIGEPDLSLDFLISSLIFELSSLGCACSSSFYFFFLLYFYFLKGGYLSSFLSSLGNYLFLWLLGRRFSKLISSFSLSISFSKSTSSVVFFSFFGYSNSLFILSSYSLSVSPSLWFSSKKALFMSYFPGFFGIFDD